MKRKSLLSAIVATTLVSVALIGCASASSEPKASRQIYQPRVLRLPAGKAVMTTDGTYVPSANEVWHSARAFEQLEQENLNLAAALAHARSRQ